MKTLQSKTIIGFINTTITGCRIVFGEVTEKKAHEVIDAIIGDIPYINNRSVIKEVVEYCKVNYSYNK